MDNNYPFDEEQIWFNDYADEEDDFQIDEYDLTSTPNDFNVITIYNFMESGAVKIPGFQRNYVWDINRASKLIESIILGLPIPQIFLYEEARNKFLIIDGQQRLMSIYYFIKGRFPLKEKRVELRRIFEKDGSIPDKILSNENYFSKFDLSLTQKLPEQPNKFKGLNYHTLGDYKTQFELRPIRNVIVKQNFPKDDSSSIYEIFNRLNSGGVNLYPQEIRASLYHSPFYEMLNRLNMEEGWRKLLQMNEPDIHMKDVELLLRGFAMLIDGEDYAPSLPKFLNNFSRRSRKNTQEQNDYLENLFKSFLRQFESLLEDPFIGKRNKRFHIALFEAVFASVCKPIFLQHEFLDSPVDISKIKQIEIDGQFIKASSEGTTKKTNVEIRLKRAKDILGIQG
ncbi:DUF262 domain-containing protein [Nostoc sp. UHCC 0251]|uniref:DUF262 domain-containing protein n=1 Tax=Nostoc sp. UHCC 0251 TaxID=3110240 RepID=UPI002B1F6EC8|nr:DUF262 domain-containing protein [Nostoc sp. UHCC 0251]MEA5623963.1 DUF262 domain-containing protein [Nostoc sp. UHCC 0251]